MIKTTESGGGTKNSFLPFEQEIAQYFKHKPEVIAVFLFGSRASGKARRDSDIDLAIVFRHNSKSMMESYVDEYLTQLASSYPETLIFQLKVDKKLSLRSKLYASNSEWD